MKHIRIICIVLTMVLCYTHPTQAGFWAKKHSSTAIATTGGQTGVISNVSKPANPIQAYRHAKRMLDNGHPGKSDTGWEGTVALVCGILGLFLLFPAIPAIIFGAMGMGKGHRNRGQAIAGFVMGCIMTFVLLLYILFFILWFGYIL